MQLIKVGRNDPCPCGSGIKFKKCCGSVRSAVASPDAARPHRQWEAVLVFLKEFAKVAPRSSYTFMAREEFDVICNAGNVRLMNQIYWREIMYRAHFGASTALIRLSRWLDGVEQGATSRNPLMLASSFRGFVEAGADTYYTFDSVPNTLAVSHVHIRSALAGTLDVPLYSPVLEEELIHFIYGRQLDREEKEFAPPSHQALHTGEYLDGLSKDVPEIKTVYRELCQMTHPASDSLFCFATRPNPLTVTIDPSVPADVFERLTTYMSSVLPAVVANSALPCFATLRVLNVFAEAGTTTPWADSIQDELMPPWTALQQRLQSPKPPPAMGKDEIGAIRDEYSRERPDILGRVRRKKKS